MPTRLNPKQHTAAIRFLEVQTHLAKERAVIPLERKMALVMARFFVRQGKRLVRQLAPVLRRQLNRGAAEKKKLQEASVKPWEAVATAVLQAMSPNLNKNIETGVLAGLAAGAQKATKDFPGMGVSFDLANPNAVLFAQTNAAANVTSINNSTILDIRRIITNAVTNGTSWTDTAKQIEAQFKQFAGPPLFPSMKFKSRSQAVASMEIGTAYEEGTKQMVAQIVDAGVFMEQKWLTAGDSKVRDSHAANEAVGWVDIDDFSQYGGATLSSVPPTDPGCRCTMLYRRKPGQEEQ